MEIPQLFSEFLKRVPGESAIDRSNPALSDAQNRRFNDWAGGIQTELGLNRFEDIPLEELDNFEYTGPTVTSDAPRSNNDALAEYFKANIPGGNTNVNSAEWNRRFNDWAGAIMTDLGLTRFEDIPLSELDNYDYTGPTGPVENEVPTEKALYDKLLPGIMDDIDRDASRRQEADNALGTIDQSYANFNRINDTLIPKLDYQKYLTDYPDVAAAYQSLAGPDGFAVMPDGRKLNPEQFANEHYNTSGKNELRNASFVSDRLTDENRQVQILENDMIANAREREATMLGNTNTARAGMDEALQNRINTMNQGTADAVTALELGVMNQADAQRQATATARAGMDAATQAALDERYAGTDRAVGEFTQALTDQTAAQRAATATARAEQDAAREKQFADRIAALQAEAASLDGVNSTLAQERRASLATEIEGLRQNQTAFRQSRIAAHDAEIESLRGVAGEAAAARRANLARERDALLAAQDPLNAARLEAAETQGSTINQALEFALDDITARQATQGFVGSDSFTDGAMMRATLEARQRAAGAVQGAKVDNAADVRSIEVRNANEARSIDDILAGSNEQIGQRAATGRRTIEDEFSTGIKGIDDRKDMDGRLISDSYSDTKAKIGSNLATGTRMTTDYNTDEARRISDEATARNLDIADIEAIGNTDIRNWGTNRNVSILDAGVADKQGNALFSVNRNLATDDMVSADKRAIGQFAVDRGLGITDMGAAGFEDNARFSIDRALSVGDETADTIANTKNGSSAMRLDYYNNDLGRSMDATLRPISQTADRINSSVALDNYANSGRQRSLDALNWWSGNAAPVTVAPFQTDPNTAMGDFYAGLGAGVANIGGNILVGQYGKNAQSKVPQSKSSQAPTIPRFVTPTITPTNTKLGG